MLIFAVWEEQPKIKSLPSRFTLYGRLNLLLKKQFVAVSYHHTSARRQQVEKCDGCHKIDQ
jgi:hypothetical protein